MLLTEASYKVGQIVRLIVGGQPALTGLVEEMVVQFVQAGTGGEYHYCYRVSVPSKCLPGRYNHLWVPQSGIGLPEEFEGPELCQSNKALLLSPAPIDDRPYFKQDKRYREAWVRHQMFSAAEAAAPEGLDAH